MAKGDARKPKGKMSAYAYFVQTCREEHKKKNPEIPVNFSEFSKKCAGRWKTMSPKEKSKFEDQANQDKARYESEMTSYGPPGKRGKKAKKDPNAPKRPPSGFFVFCAEQRPKIKAQHPSFGIGDVAKKLGEAWNNLTDSSKQPYLAKANKLKEKYRKDVADYKRGTGKPGGAGASKPKKAENVDEDDEDEEDDEEDDDDDEDDD
ncbi:high mobility group box 3b [Esox lucius]|uniref:High mobility group protein B3 n=1 Tax=Esox lucius TaxID=8010 RepID=C1BWI2_ESOLU|nr:high mobility group protein B3b [Esox lucius]ACO13385.1 High mobility group protein B3 [Esox lucius]